MPRIARGRQGGFAYHIINRANGRAEIFHKNPDYEAFLSLLPAAKARHPVKVFAFCLMPNHFHFVLEPAHTTALSQFMQWLLTTHVRRYHKHYGGSSHIWQGRFNSCPIQRDKHLITVLRYVLQNPVRAGLSSSAKDWQWSSLQRAEVVDRWPPADEPRWQAQLDELVSDEELTCVRESVNRQRPFGEIDWQAELASRFGLGTTLRPRGRPKTERKSRLSVRRGSGATNRLKSGAGNYRYTPLAKIRF